MKADRINQMCRILPAPEEDIVRDNFRIRAADTQVGITDPEIGRFATAYKDLSFGWNFARTMALNRRPMQVPLNGRDEWVWRAYLYAINPIKYKDKALAEAITWMGADYAKERSVANALLVSGDMDLDKIAKVLNKKQEVISAYEILFFNIWDRKADELFLSSIIYPNGRAVEFFNGYTTNEGLDVQLLRAGFNNGAAHVLHLAGFSSQLVTKYLSADTVQRLESFVMANGLILAMNGWLNQGPEAGHGVNSALRLISAAKAGGQDEKTSPFQNSGGQVLMAEMQRVKAAAHAKRTTEFYRGKPTMEVSGAGVN